MRMPNVRRRLGVGRPKCEAKCKARLGVYFSYSTMFKPQIRLVQLWVLGALFFFGQQSIDGNAKEGLSG